MSSLFTGLGKIFILSESDCANESVAADLAWKGRTSPVCPDAVVNERMNRQQVIDDKIIPGKCRFIGE